MDLEKTGVDFGKEDMLIPVDSEVNKFFVLGELELWCKFEVEGFALEKKLFF